MCAHLTHKQTNCAVISGDDGSSFQLHDLFWMLGERDPQSCQPKELWNLLKQKGWRPSEEPESVPILLIWSLPGTPKGWHRNCQQEFFLQRMQNHCREQKASQVPEMWNRSVQQLILAPCCTCWRLPGTPGWTVTHHLKDYWPKMSCRRMDQQLPGKHAAWTARSVVIFMMTQTFLG